LQDVRAPDEPRIARLRRAPQGSGVNLRVRSGACLGPDPDDATSTRRFDPTAATFKAKPAELLKGLKVGQTVDFYTAVTGAAVHPVGGWWKTRLRRGEIPRVARYSLIVEMDAGGTDVDLYSEVLIALQAQVAAAITIEI
jgi:hypothetical protein